MSFMIELSLADTKYTDTDTGMTRFYGHTPVRECPKEQAGQGSNSSCRPVPAACHTSAEEDTVSTNYLGN